MGISDAVLAAGRILIDSPQILSELKKLSDDQGALNREFGRFVEEVKGEVRHLAEHKDELRRITAKLQDDVTSLRLVVAGTAQSSELVATQQRLAQVEAGIRALDTFIDRSITLSAQRHVAALPPPSRD